MQHGAVAHGQVITQPQGLSAEEVERQITVPLEVALAGMPGLDHIRSQSLFGLSDVKCYFNWGTDYKDARQEVIAGPTCYSWDASGNSVILWSQPAVRDGFAAVGQRAIDSAIGTGHE